MGKKVIIIGTCSIIGRGILLECIKNPRIKNILLINTSSINIYHHKIQEVIINDFKELNQIINDIDFYHACYFCMDTSTLEEIEEKNTFITYRETKALVNYLKEKNPNILLIYISETGFKSSKKKIAVKTKGKTLSNIGILDRIFNDAYAFKPGIILPERGIKSAITIHNWIYTLLRPTFPILKFSKNVTTTTKVGKAMTELLFQSIQDKQISNKHINKITQKII